MNPPDQEVSPSIYRFNLPSGPLTAELVKDLDGACDQIDDATHKQRLLLIRLGAQQHQPCPAANSGQVTKWEHVLRRIERLRAVTIATVEGLCTGVAFEALLCADYRIIEPQARVVIPSFHGHSLPGMWLYRMTHQMGAARARRFALFGGELSAHEALDAGLVNEVTPDLVSSEAVLIDRFRSLDGKAVAIRRQLVLEASISAYEAALGTHLAATEQALRDSGG